MTLILQKNLLSTKDAAVLSGYNADYLSRLCRAGKITGTQVGRTWLIDSESLETFVREQEERKREIATELSQTREKEYQQAQNVVSIQSNKNPNVSPAVRSPFVSVLRAPAAAFVATLVIMGGSVYAAFGPVGAAVDHAGAITSSVIRAVGGAHAEAEPRLRIASSISSSVRNGIPDVRAQFAKSLTPVIDSATIRSMLAFIDLPDARAESGHRIVAYDDAATRVASLQHSRAHAERAFSRFIDGDITLSHRAISAYVALGSGTRDTLYSLLDSYDYLINRSGENALAAAATTRDLVAAAPGASMNILDTYEQAVVAWVHGSHTVVAIAVDAETSAGPTAVALVQGSTEYARVFTYNVQRAVDTQLLVMRSSVASIPDVSLPEVRIPNGTAIVANPVEFSPFTPVSAESFVNTGRGVALGTYNIIHGWRSALNLSIDRVLAYLRGSSRLAIVPLPPAVTVPGYSVRPTEGVVYGSGGGTSVTNIQNFYSTTGVTQEALDMRLTGMSDSLARLVRRSSGGGGGDVVNGGDITASSLHVTGDSDLDGDLTLGGTLTSSGEITAPFFTATSLSATSTLPNLVVNSFGIGGDYITDFVGTGLAIVNGVLTATGSTTSTDVFEQGGNAFGTTATLGTTDANPLNFITNNLARMTIDASGNVGIGTTTPGSLLTVAGTVSGDIFVATGTGTSTLPRILTSAIALGSDYLSDFTGTGLTVVNGALGLDSANNYFSTTSTDYWFTTKTTDALAEGVTNLYFTNARADARINATSTIGTLTSAPNLGTVATTLTGILKATAGVLSPATAGTDYENALTFAYPLVRAVNSISLAFGTTTANSWSALQQFNGGASTTALTVTGASTLGTLTATNATSTTFQTNTLGVGSSYFTSLTGSGLVNTSGVLTLDRTGAWTGTFDGQEGSYYLDLANHTGVLAQANGGTGIASYTQGDILYADSGGNLVTLPLGSAGQVLKVQAGLPAWGVDQTTSGGGGGDGIFATSTGIIYPANTSDVLVLGSNATSTTNSIFEVIGQQYISSRLGIATTTAPTQLSVSGSGYFTGGLGVGILNTVAGTLRTSGNATIGGTLAVTGAFTAGNATTTSLQTDTLGVGSSYFTSLTGSGLVNTAGVLTLDRTGDWTGTFDGQEGSYYLNATNLTNFGERFYSFFSATTTDALAEGLTNFYFTNARADARINATSTIGTLISAPNLTTVNTSLTGLLKATSGVLSVASAGTDYQVPLTFTYPLVNSANTISLAFGTTTANTWSAANNFTSTVALASTTPWAQLSINPTATNGSAPSFAIGSSSATRFVVTNAGLVGIGTTTPLASLSIDGQGSTTGSAPNALSAYGGTSLSGNGGAIALRGGLGSDGGGSITLVGGIGTGGSGGPVSLTGGLGAVGGGISITGGATQTAGSSAGTVTLRGGAVSDPLGFGGLGFAGGISLVGGNATGVLSTGGSVLLNPGTGSTTGNVRLSSTGVGLVSVGATSTPWALFSINPIASITTAPQFAIGSSTGTSFIVTNAGRVGIGTSTPGSLLSIQGIANFTTATSTFNSTGGLNLTGGGCFAINGTCVGGNTLTFAYPLQLSGTNVSLAFGTTTANQWSAQQDFNGGLTATTILTSGSITTGSQFIGLNADSASAPSFTWASDLTTGIFHAGANSIGFTTSGIERARFNSSGFLGIATSTPGSLLSIGDVVNFTTATSTFYGTGGLNLTAGCYAVNGTCITNFSNTLANGGTATTTFYNGGVVFSDGTKLTQSSAAANFFWSESNKFLGLGSSTPWGQLSVNPVATNGSAPSFVIGSSSATQFVVTNGGKVGINTSSIASGVALQINGETDSGSKIALLRGDQTITSGELLGDLFFGGTDSNVAAAVAIEAASAEAFTGSANGAYLTFKTTPTGTQNLTERLRIDSTGYIGISSTTPWGQLSINPVAGNGTAPQFAIGSSTGTSFIVTNAGNVGIGTSTPGSLLSIQGIANFTTATSTFNSTGGINLTSGCFAINGTCVGGNTLTFAYPLQLSGTNVSLAFGTTTANAWSAQQDFNGGLTATTILTSGAITTGSQFIGLNADGASAPSFTWASDLGTGIFHAGANAIGFSTSGIERARFNSSGFLGIATSTFSSALSVEGNVLFHGSTTIDGLGSGVLKATNGLIEPAIAGTDYQAPLTATYPIQLSSNILSLAFGTTTANTWGAANNFTSTVALSSTTPWAQLSINPTNTNGTAPAFAIGSSTGTNFVVTNAGRVGIGTSTP
ncbi:MAG: hypothetical protein AB202_03970, partial [Parcubacteria bacterium C7867-007]